MARVGSQAQATAVFENTRELPPQVRGVARPFVWAASESIYICCDYENVARVHFKKNDQPSIQREAIKILESLLTADVPPLSTPSTDGLFSHIPSLISVEDNEMLLRSPSIEEVRDAVLKMPKDGALGLDGLSAAFFARCWSIIGGDVHAAAADFFSGGALPRTFTSTLVYLVPKKLGAKSFSDYRPISLCNVVYKIFANIIAGRLAVLLPKMISLEQGAFVRGHFITENIALCQEVLETLTEEFMGATLL
ncbi:uncharacterized protein LOC131238798 [Magnolia sinica]|uniref:uncharacterized protein LOC131238798 n=1 Tax=Magnolia sinica TaxID=86752 RepID=UPI0026597242|nr:uncharacterized protein LOC131238798 [Magnolia sinica]